MQVDEQNKKSYPPLDQLSTEELERLLRTPDKSELDVDFIQKAMEVIQARESDLTQPDVDGAWQAFLEDYQGQSEAYEPSKNTNKKVRTRKSLWIFQRIAVLAAVLFLLCGTASAFRLDILKVFVKWTTETLHFTSSQSADVSQSIPENDPYQELREAVAEYTDTPLVPTWAPEGTEQVGELSITERSTSSRIQGTYGFQQREFTIRIETYHETPVFDVSIYQKDDTDIKKYEYHGILHYILSNLDQDCVVWVNGKSIVFIQGSLDVTDIQDMVKSIYEE